MAEIIFNYKGNTTIIQCNKEDKMKEVFNKFALKTQTDKNLIYFIYGGNINLNEDLTFEELANQNDKLRNKMSIIVNDKANNTNSNISAFKKSKDIICPKCHESIKLKIEEYKIKLYECKGKHEDVIFINELEETQKIDLSNIKCDKCKENNKNKTFNNQFFRCNTCKLNICPLCKSNHDKNHNIIDYDNKNYICEHHNEIYSLYCNECKQNICMHCENEHNKHKIISCGKIFPKIDIGNGIINKLEK